MFFKSPRNQNNGDVGGSFRPVLQFTVNWLGAWPEKSGIGPEAELVSVRGPGPGSGSDTGVTRLRPGVPGLMSGSTGGCQLRGHHNTCVQWPAECTGAGRWTAQLASAPVDLFCLDTPGCGREAGERKRPSCYTSLYIPRARVSRPRPFLATYLQTHPLLASSPEPELTSNTRHRGQARHHVT